MAAKHHNAQFLPLLFFVLCSSVFGLRKLGRPALKCNLLAHVLKFRPTGFSNAPKRYTSDFSLGK